jgi:hypothetical protein
MPRKAPNLNGGVIEHRITLGDYERKMITKQLAEDDTIKKVQTGAEIGKTVLIGAGGIALGTLAVTAYREANDLIDTVTDVPAGLWKTAQYKLGLISLEQLVGSISDDVEENEKASEERKNKGVLEWGVEWLLKFLLGEDMIFTKATESDTNGDDTDPNPYAPENDEFEPNRYDPQDPYYSTSSDWYWHGALNHWMPITRYDDVYNPQPQPKPKPSEGASYWENLERTFCDITSPDYNEEACRDVQFDKLRAGF